MKTKVLYSGNENVDSLRSIVEIVSSIPEFSILVQAIIKADLVNAINNPTGLTVFAPTNDAFDALFSNLKVSGLNDLSKEALTPILLYHVLGVKVFSSAIETGYVYSLSPGLKTKTLAIYLDTVGGVTINKSTEVIQADILASNGVIHAIDRVLIPNTIVDIASNNDNFTTLVTALVKADLVNTLQGAGPFTVFAPTNDAFKALFASLGVSGIDALNKEQLTPILLYHVVSGNVLSTDLKSGEVTTLNTAKINVKIGSQVTINTTSTVTLADIQGTNGVIHVIDKVLLPSS